MVAFDPQNVRTLGSNETSGIWQSGGTPQGQWLYGPEKERKRGAEWNWKRMGGKGSGSKRLRLGMHGSISGLIVGIFMLLYVYHMLRSTLNFIRIKYNTFNAESLHSLACFTVRCARICKFTMYKLISQI